MSKPTTTTIGPREESARKVLDGLVQQQADVRDRLVDLRAQRPDLVSARDELDAQIGRDDDGDLFDRMGTAALRVESLDRRIQQAEEDAQHVDFEVKRAQVTVDFRRAEDVAEEAAAFDRAGHDAQFLERIREEWDRYQAVLYAQDDRVDEVRRIARQLRDVPGADMSTESSSVRVGDVRIEHPSYMQADAARSVFTGLVDRRADESRRAYLEAEAERAAERREEEALMRQIDRERMAFFAGGSAEPGVPMNSHAPGKPHVHPSVLGGSTIDQDPSAF